MRFAKGYGPHNMPESDKEIIRQFARELSERPVPRPKSFLIDAHTIMDEALKVLQSGAPGLAPSMQSTLATMIANHCQREARSRTPHWSEVFGVMPCVGDKETIEALYAIKIRAAKNPCAQAILNIARDEALKELS